MAVPVIPERVNSAVLRSLQASQSRVDPLELGQLLPL